MQQHDTHEYTVEHFQRNIETVARGASINLVGTGMRTVLVYAQSIIIARLLGISSYGVYSIAFSLFTVLLLGGQLGMDRAIVRYVSEYRSLGLPDRVKTVLVRSFQFSGGVTLLVALTLYMSADRIAQAYASTQLSAVLRYFALSLPAAVIAQLLSAFTQAFRAMRFKFLVQDLFRPLLELVLSVALVLVGFSVAGLAVAYLIASLVGAFLLWHFANRLVALDQTPVARDLAMRPMLAFAAPVLVSDLLQRASAQQNVLIVGAIMDEASAGAFNAASQLITRGGGLFLVSFGLILAPIISTLYHSHRHRQLEQLFCTATRWILILTLPIFVLISYLAVPILNLFGLGFAVAAPAMMFLAAGQFANVSVGTAGVLLNMSGRTYLSMINSAAAFVGRLLISSWLIPRYGLVGAGISAGLIAALVNIALVIEIQLLLKLRPYNRGYGKPLLAGLAGGAVALLAHNGLGSAGLAAQYAGGAGLFLFGYVVTLLLLKFEPEERHLWHSLHTRINQAWWGRWR